MRVEPSFLPPLVSGLVGFAWWCSGEWSLLEFLDGLAPAGGFVGELVVGGDRARPVQLVQLFGRD